MPGHGNHWETLYSIDEYIEKKLTRDTEKSKLICRAECVDIEDGTDRTEQVVCLRWGNEKLANQILLVSNSAKQSHVLFSSYPVALDGIDIDVTITRLAPWEYGIEGWVHGYVLSEQVPICFFDTMYFVGSAALQKAETIRYRLAGFAYMLRPIQTRSFMIDRGGLWEMEKARRLEEGESEEEASRPVEVHRTGSTFFLQRGDDQCDEAEFQGVIETIDAFEYDGQKIYRLEMLLMRPNDEEFRLPVYASERVLDGYVPRLGEDVEGALWLQGRRPKADTEG